MILEDIKNNKIEYWDGTIPCFDGEERKILIKYGVIKLCEE